MFFFYFGVWSSPTNSISTKLGDWALSHDSEKNHWRQWKNFKRSSIVIPYYHKQCWLKKKLKPILFCSPLMIQIVIKNEWCQFVEKYCINSKVLFMPKWPTSRLLRIGRISGLSANLGSPNFCFVSLKKVNPVWFEKLKTNEMRILIFRRLFIRVFRKYPLSSWSQT